MAKGFRRYARIGRLSEIALWGRLGDAADVGPHVDQGALWGKAEVVTFQLPGGPGGVDLADEIHVSQHGRVVFGKECAGPVRTIVDPWGASRFDDFIAAVGLDPIVSDFSSLPLDLVSQIIELIAAVESEQGIFAVGRAQNGVFGEN